MYLIQRSPERARHPSGFTLIELMVALAISGLLVTIIFRLLQGNTLFVQRQSAREEVQQNARAALQLVVGDLRSVPPAAILDMDPASVHFDMPRAWGILCNELRPESPTAWVLFPADMVPDPDFFTNIWSKKQWGIAAEQTTDPLVPTGDFRFVNQVSQQTTGDPCAAIQPNLTSDHVRYGFNHPAGTSFVTADSLLPGTQVLLYEEMKYDVASSSVVPGTWIRRMSGYNGSGTPNMQPMAGPVPDSGALHFTYLKADGSTTASTPAEVRQIGIRIIAQSHSETGTGALRRPQQMDTVATDVYLRNFQD